MDVINGSTPLVHGNFCNTVTCRVNTLATTTVNNLIRNSTKCNTLYNLVDRNIPTKKPAKFLEIVNDESGLIISRFRSRNHHLGCETGDWAGSVYEGKCDCIECNVMETEQHFIFECSLYTDIRSRYIIPFIPEAENV